MLWQFGILPLSCRGPLLLALKYTSAHCWTKQVVRQFDLAEFCFWKTTQNTDLVGRVFSALLYKLCKLELELDRQRKDNCPLVQKIAWNLLKLFLLLGRSDQSFRLVFFLILFLLSDRLLLTTSGVWILVWL